MNLLGRFRGLGGLGVYGSDRKGIQLRACKIWCQSVRKTYIMRPTIFPFVFFNFRALGVESPRRGAIGRHGGWAKDSIMRHISHHGEEEQLTRFEKHMGPHLPGIIKRALRNDGTRRKLGEKFLGKFIKYWREKNWFSTAKFYLTSN